MSTTTATTTPSLSTNSLSSSITSLPNRSSNIIPTDIIPTKLFHKHASSTPITSIAHNPQGTHLLSSGTDATIQLYDIVRGRYLKTIYSKKYGCTLATFPLRTISQSTPRECIFASTMHNHALRLLDLTDNSFVRYFNGHEAQVTTLTTAKSSVFGVDSFYSASRDGTVKSWDARSEKWYASLGGVGNDCVIAVDPSNCVMAIWISEKSVLQFVAMEKFPMGLIGEVDLHSHIDNNLSIVEKIEWCGNSGLIIVDIVGKEKIVVDSFKLNIIGKLSGLVNFVVEGEDVSRSGSISVSSDGKWCVGGSGDGCLLIWDLNLVADKKSLDPEVRIRPDSLIEQDIIPRIVDVNPNLGLTVTADTEVVLSVYK